MVTNHPPRSDTHLSRSKRLSTVPANSRTEDKYTVLVVKIAQIVPIGMLFCASAKSPERFEPAMIPAFEINNKSIGVCEIVMMEFVF